MSHMSLTFGKYVYIKHLITAHRNLISSDSLKVPGVNKMKVLEVCLSGRGFY